LSQAPSRSLKRYFLTGFFVVIPAGVTIFMVVWFVGALDGLLQAPFERVLGFHVPGLGLVASVALFIVVGMLMSNLLVQHLFEFFEEALMRVPGVRAVYKTVKALTDTFSPENQKAFRHVVLVEYPHPGSWALGFVTSRMDFTWPDGRREEQVSVYVPTNHVYLGNNLVVPAAKVLDTNLTVQQGIQIALASGAGFPDQSFQK
jgi:uncharacterized membrane protein